MRRLKHCHRWFVLFAVIAGCNSDALKLPPDMAPSPVRLQLRNPANVDVLFVIDNTYPGPLFGHEIAISIDHLIAPFKARPSDLQSTLHVGVITTDYGAGATGAPGCSPSPGGQQGRLRGIGVEVSTQCMRPAPDDYTGTGQKQPVNYVRYDFGGDAINNLPNGETLVDAIDCMAGVGGDGCGFRHPLEATRAALAGGLPENAGFLRDDAALGVLFMTDSDDCSGPPDSDLYDKTKVAQYGYLDTYRCRHYGVVCGDPPMSLTYGPSNGPLANCRPAPSPTGLFDVNRYIDLFTKPRAQGGLKSDPLDVVLYAIDAPETPFQVILTNPFDDVTPSCPTQSDVSLPPCTPMVQDTCVNAQNPEFFGGPPIRLNAVVNAAQNHGTHSICDIGHDYADAFDEFARLLLDRFGDGCLPAPLMPNGDGGAQRVDCTVYDTQSNKELPRCGSGAMPCWDLTTDAACIGHSPSQARIVFQGANSLDAYALCNPQ